MDLVEEVGLAVAVVAILVGISYEIYAQVVKYQYEQ